MTSTARASFSCLVALTTLWIGCGGSKPPAPAAATASNGPPAASSGASWDDLCKLAEARLQRCKISSDAAVQSVGKCGGLTTCLTDVYDPSGVAVLKTCLAADDCEACDKAAVAAPSPAAKAYAAKVATKAPTCAAFDPADPYPAGKVSALFGAKAYAIYDECIAKPCMDAMSCMGMQTVSNEPLIACDQFLGLTFGEGDDYKELLNKPAPELTGESIGKKPVPKIVGSGKWVVLYFWMTNAGKPDESLGGLESFAKQNKDVIVVAVNEDPKKEDATASVAKAKLTIPVIWDKDNVLANQWGGSPFGATLMVDTKGIVVSRGSDKFDPKGTKAAIVALTRTAR